MKRMALAESQHGQTESLDKSVTLNRILGNTRSRRDKNGRSVAETAKTAFDTA